MKIIVTEKIKNELFNASKKQQLLTEERLANLLGVSRTPIREALKELEHKGVIKRQKKGICLKPFSLKEIVEVFDTRAVLEGFAGRLATEKIKEADLKELNDIVKEYNKSLEQNDLNMEDAADYAFHKKIMQLSGNSIIVKIIDNFSILIKSFRINHSLATFPRMDKSPYTHEKIIQTLKEKDPDKCDRIIQLHIQFSKQKWIETMLDTKINQFTD